ncbi:MAG TPA: thioredoxin family protein [Verrucomicrobiae bacterium]
MKTLFALSFVLFSMTVLAAGGPYNENADAKLDIKKALSQASVSNTPVIIVFGANWCGDCKMLDHAMKSGTSAALISRDFTVVKVDVGYMDKNVDLAKSYGVPLDKGIPAIAIVSPKNDLLYSTRAGELADAEQMGEAGIYKFLKQVTASYVAKK